MVVFPINTGIRKVGAEVGVPEPKAIDEEWISFDVVIRLSSSNVIATIVVDFAYTVSSIIEYTLDGGANFIAFNNGDAVAGTQSRFIDVSNGDAVNFRAKNAGTLIRLVVSSLP